MSTGARRYAQLYFALFLSLGALFPYFALFLRDRGLTITEIGIASLAFPISRIVVPPVMGVLADTRLGVQVLMRLSAVLALLIAPGFYFVEGMLPAALLLFVYASARGPLISLANSGALETVQQTGEDFSFVRLFGSIGFIVGALAGGLWVDIQPIGRLPDLVTVSLLLTLVTVWRLPESIDPLRQPTTFRRLRSLAAGLLQQRFVVYFLAALVLARVAEGAYAIYFSVYVVDIGMTSSMAGLLWAIGVVSEVGVLAVAQHIHARHGYAKVLMMCAIVSTLRWLGIGWNTSLFVFAALQLLHGITFGLFYVAAVEQMYKLAPKQMQATSQTLLDTVMFGIGGIVGQLLFAPIYETAGGQSVFLIAAAIGAISVVPAILMWRLAPKNA